MTAPRDQTAAYDQMMAEIQLDSDDEEQQARRVQTCAKNITALGSKVTTASQSTMASAEPKASDATRSIGHRPSAKETKPSPGSSTTSDTDRESTGNSEEDRSANAKPRQSPTTGRNRRSSESEDSDDDHGDYWHPTYVLMLRPFIDNLMHVFVNERSRCCKARQCRPV